MKPLSFFILFLSLLLLLPFITLGERGVVEEYIVEEAKSNEQQLLEVITRGEFSSLLAQSLHLSPAEEAPFRDLLDHPERGTIGALYQEGLVEGYPEGNFLPNIQLTRGEAATIISRALLLHHEEHRPKTSETPHWASSNIALLFQLGFMESQDPHEYIKKKEAHQMIHHLQNLKALKGTITETYPLSQKIAIQTEHGRELVDYTREALVFRNNREVAFEELRAKDSVFFIQNRAGEVEYLKATGILDEREIAMELSDLLGGILSWQEVEALAKGDWEMLGNRALSEVEEYLLQEGLTPNEIQALLSTDWEAINELGRVRLIEALAMETGVPRDLMRAIINWNWEEIIEITQLELLQLLVEELLNPSYLNM